LAETLRQLVVTLGQLETSLRKLAASLRQDDVTLRQLAETLRQIDGTLGQMAASLRQNSTTLFLFAESLFLSESFFFNPSIKKNGEIPMATTTTTKSTHRATVSLNLPKSVPALIVYAEGIVKRMTGNPSFPAPTPSLATLTASIDDLKAAEMAAVARTKGAATARNDKRKALVGVLQQLRSYVQSVADADAANAASIIESAGIGVRKTPTRHARAFIAKPGRVSGEAVVTAAVVARRASYEWQYSTDGGKTWITAPSTLQAKTTITGFAPLSTVQFKYRTLTKTGEGDWSAPVSLTIQ